MTSILDRRFHYTPAVATDVAATWRKYGYKPVTPAQRDRKQQQQQQRALRGAA